jgi:3-deoxy-7-phosphoheptulonate synthase
MSVNAACERLAEQGLREQVLIDVSHANSQKEPMRQIVIVEDIAHRVAQRDRRIIGVMVESHLKSGRQHLMPGKQLVYGQSITDPCIGWHQSVMVLEKLAAAV